MLSTTTVSAPVTVRDESAPLTVSPTVKQVEAVLAKGGYPKTLSASDPVTAPRTSPTVSEQVKIFEAQRDDLSRSVVENRVQSRRSQK